MSGRPDDHGAAPVSTLSKDGDDRVGAGLVEDPYPHAVLEAVLGEAESGELLRWLSEDASWVVESNDLYTQYRCTNILDLICCDRVRIRSALLRLAGVLEQTFDVCIDRRRVEISAHKLVRGQYIGAHTDMPHGVTETHRAVISVASPTAPVVGGELTLLRSEHPSDAAVRIAHSHDRAVLMELSDRSLHAVTPVRSGSRYSIVTGYWTVDPGWESVPHDHQRTPLPRHLMRVLERLGACSVPHAGRHVRSADHRAKPRPLCAHLAGTYAVLRNWGAEPDVCAAGLLHGLYGPLGIGTALLWIDERDVLRKAVGARVEELVYLYSVLDRRSDEVSADGLYRTRLLGRDLMETIDGAKLAAVFLISWASRREQAPRAGLSPGEADEITARLELFDSLVPDRAAADLRTTFGF
ncbi:2OG-Fe(II) oxygenase [Plantactinospora solaniradicis]|uniref:2OG-Fe(II) oxygenase n=1 Tax=Plantactinospora solaniradicis TaxID=1723736 RepID=A0ABW1KQF3_9ACTN